MPDLIHPAPTEFTPEQIASDPVLRYFHYSHLPEALQQASKPFCDVAEFIIQTIPRNAERSVALRKLLEAKDAAVRANIPDLSADARALKTHWDNKLARADRPEPRPTDAEYADRSTDGIAAAIEDAGRALD